jgi:hypothetical protein
MMTARIMVVVTDKDGGGERTVMTEKREKRFAAGLRERTRKEKEDGGLGFYKITPPFNIEMSKLPMVLYLCQIICVWLSLLL